MDYDGNFVDWSMSLFDVGDKNFDVICVNVGTNVCARPRKPWFIHRNLPFILAYERP